MPRKFADDWLDFQGVNLLSLVAEGKEKKDYLEGQLTTRQPGYTRVRFQVCMQVAGVTWALSNLSENQKTVAEETKKMTLMQSVLIKVWWSYAP